MRNATETSDSYDSIPLPRSVFRGPEPLLNKIQRMIRRDEEMANAIAPGNSNKKQRKLEVCNLQELNDDVLLLVNNGERYNGISRDIVKAARNLRSQWSSCYEIMRIYALQHDSSAANTATAAPVNDMMIPTTNHTSSTDSTLTDHNTTTSHMTSSTTGPFSDLHQTSPTNNSNNMPAAKRNAEQAGMNSASLGLKSQQPATSKACVLPTTLLPPPTATATVQRTVQPSTSTTTSTAPAQRAPPPPTLPTPTTPTTPTTLPSSTLHSTPAPAPAQLNPTTEQSKRDRDIEHIKNALRDKELFALSEGDVQRLKDKLVVLLLQ